MRSLQLKYSVHLYCRMPFFLFKKKYIHTYIYLYIYAVGGVFIHGSSFFKCIHN